MDDCIFCKIIKGDIPCYKVYEDSTVMAWLDIKPLSKGHVLVVPKVHSPNIHEIPEDTLCEVTRVAKLVAGRMNDKLHPEAIFINQNNGEKAGQTIMHFHVHIKPIYEDTECYSEEGKRAALTPEEMKEVEEILRID